MPRLFIYGTKLQEMEQLMILVPRFSPRQKGLIVVGETTELEGGIKKCRSYEKCGKANCGGATCTNFTNSMGMGKVTYREMIMTTNSYALYQKEELRSAVPMKNAAKLIVEEPLAPILRTAWGWVK